MLQFLTSSKRRSSTPSTFSSPALPELSIDASLQRLHHQEDISTSSISSVHPSRHWLRKDQASSSEEDAYSPIRSDSGKGEGDRAFRFPPLLPSDPLEPASATHALGPLEASADLQEALQARPRTSRGLSYPKPFLSSSRTSSINSIAEFDHQRTLPDFETTQRSHSARHSSQPVSRGQEAVNLTANVVASEHRRKSTKNSLRGVADSSARAIHAPVKRAAEIVSQSSHLHASQVPENSSTSSSWTMLLAPIQPSPSPRVGEQQNDDHSTILLPLMSSFEDQVEHLRSQLITCEQSINQNRKIDLFLDLSSVSTLSSVGLAHLTPQSWSIIFRQHLQKQEEKDQQPLPYLYRETGLPIVALVRYSLATTTSETHQGISDGESKDGMPSLHSSRKQYQSSRRSSRDSVSSDTASLSPRSTRPTSFHSSHARERSDSHRHTSQDDGDSDPDLGARFWTQLHSLGRQVSSGDSKLTNTDRRGGPTVSLSSTASDASVFDFSPLGILVPTDTAVAADPQKRDILGGENSSIPVAKAQIASTSMTSASGPQSTTPLWKRRRAYSSMVPLTGWRAGDNDLDSFEGQTGGSVQRLPQVLLVEPGEEANDDGPGGQPSDSITPTVTTFQGRTRALSHQLPQKMREDPNRSRMIGSRLNRQDIWDEAMSQLNERLGQFLEQFRVVPRGLVGGLPSPREPQSRVNSDATNGSTQPSGSSSRQSHAIDSADLVQPEAGSLSLPGLFYDPWVEQVDGAVDGQLGRRRSTARTPGSPLACDIGIREHDDAASKTSTPTSDCTAVDSIESEQPLQSPQVLEPPPLGTRDRAFSPADSLADSPINSHVTTQGEGQSGSIQDATLCRGTRRTASEDIGSARPSGTALEPVWLMRSQSISVPAFSQPAFNDTVQRSYSSAVAGSSDPMTGWANMAQRLHSSGSMPRSQSAGVPAFAQPSFNDIIHRSHGAALPLTSDPMADWTNAAERLDSPGSLRLLCLAAANWSPNAVDGSDAQRARNAPRLTAPISSLTRSRFLDATQDDSESARQDTRATSERSNARTEAIPRRALLRDRAATLAPIHITPRNASANEEAPRAANAVTARMKRSLSNIFDLPSPVALPPRRE
ncbi:hypothetical protein PHSY_005324 [Pseudozyma hubeiensis SY62]|uniref:Uncharacterized protein n=1 Tax=Pseudozyma hubeiensis (strain SY62) TaxID=1305764 RepID=R9P8Z6_PSEHS|nr:hypothetical protein PHSY_005324 [Pseudozyma hubeiensis SY62]GAC97737.1 hypothetical protein PHSY_005324 [Pseudozyma hubeiensis SY62]